MSGETRYPDSRNPNSIQHGLEFQDLITDCLREHGLYVQNYSSRKYQLDKGENVQGWEIKYDSWCTKSGRLSIEVEERTALDRPWVKSGIYSGKSWLYIQGNEQRFWVFFTSFLRQLHQSGRYAEKDDNPATIKTFYLPVSDADKYGQRFDIEQVERELAF